MSRRKVDCIGMVGKYQTPHGLDMFWDSGKTATPAQLAKAALIQREVGELHGNLQYRQDVMQKAHDTILAFAKSANVYAPHPAMTCLAEDGRILVSAPWYEEEVPDADV